MKALHQLTNTEKAKLLHALFPEEMKPLIENIKKVCQDLEEGQEHYRATWDFGFFSFDQWLALSRQVLERINKFEYNMIRSSKVFSDQLCFSHQALFVNDRIIKYAEKVSTDEKFKSQVKVLYT